MTIRSYPTLNVTRRGLLIGAGLVAAPFVIRSRPASVEPVAITPNRTFPRADLMRSPNSLFETTSNNPDSVRILDVSDLATWRDRHIPGAIHTWWQDTMELNAIYYGMVLKPDDDKGNQRRRVRYLERLGINSSDQIVVYGSGDPRNAARVCWFLRFLGLNSSVLDGGLAGWLGVPAATTRRSPAVVESHAPPIAPTSGYYLFANEAAALIGIPGVQIIDLRDPQERASGPFRTLSVPGALNLSRSDLVAGQTLRSPDELTSLFQVAGIDLGARLILLAPTGLDTATPWLALSLMGAAQVTIVDGGWQQWLNSPGAPVTA